MGSPIGSLERRRRLGATLYSPVKNGGSSRIMSGEQRQGNYSGELEGSGRSAVRGFEMFVVY